MRTPRPADTPRGTLIDNGWLRESARNVWRGRDIRGAALRKCVFIPAADPNLAARLRAVSPASFSPAAAPGPKAAVAPIVPHRRDPNKDVRIFAAVSANDIAAHHRAPMGVGNASPPSPNVPRRVQIARSRWYEDPIALGAILIMVPPIGITIVWSSKRYSNDARWVLTVMTALMALLCAAFAIAVIAIRSWPR